MEAFVRLTGIAAPLLRINVDTDQIIPARFLVRVSDAGIGEGLFADWRRRADGSPDPDFILNREPWTRAEILLADRNFGCGSSREGAPKALRDRGFRAVIAPSFGGIFFNNCFRNGLLPVELPIAEVRLIAAAVEATQGQAPVTVDLERQAVTTPGGHSFPFRTPPVLRAMLLEGVDEIALTLRRAPEIAAFRDADRPRRPWAYLGGQTSGVRSCNPTSPIQHARHDPRPAPRARRCAGSGLAIQHLQSSTADVTPGASPATERATQPEAAGPGPGRWSSARSCGT